MPSLSTHEFENFVRKIGLHEDEVQALVDAKIRSPQELGSMKVEELRGLCNNAFLLNHVHPILKKYVFNISTAKDPYKKAWSIFKKHAPKDEDSDEEPMDTSNTTASDAGYFITENSTGNEDNGSSGAIPERPTPDSNAVVNNSEAVVQAAGNEAVQSNIDFGGYRVKPSKKNGLGPSISISGGNFVQANILGTGPVTYNNTNTVISTTLGPGGAPSSSDLKKMRMQFLNDSFVMAGNLVRMKDVSWTDGADFWIDGDLTMGKSDKNMYIKSFASTDVYQVRNFGKSRALVINNSKFSSTSRMNSRTGADRDGENMQRALTSLGFQVEVVANKRSAEIRQKLHEFATSPNNLTADIVAVYIGSHGERDERGNDAFVGTDGNRIKFDDVREMFSPTNAPLLTGKPKIFFLQFCRQETGETPPPPPSRAFVENTQSDSVPSAADDETRCMDLLCVYATLAGNKAYRDTKDGSWFVTGLIRVLRDHAHKDDMLSMLTKVNNSVSCMEGKEGTNKAIQISEVVHNLRKKIYFWPGMQL